MLLMVAALDSLTLIRYSSPDVAVDELTVSAGSKLQASQPWSDGSQMPGAPTGAAADVHVDPLEVSKLPLEPGLGSSVGGAADTHALPVEVRRLPLPPGVGSSTGGAAEIQVEPSEVSTFPAGPAAVRPVPPVDGATVLIRP